MNPRQMKQAMKRMGIQQTEIDAIEVIIKTKDKVMVFHEPQVSAVVMMGQKTFQIVGDFEERGISSDITQEDVKTVAQQANVSEEAAKKALETTDGDLAEAILSLQHGRN